MALEPTNKLKVALFCGGRGSQYLIRELLRWPRVDLTLLVNAYDDGLSTGALRALIPGMLGPSDFRKNLSYLLGLYSPRQVALQKLIEYRTPLDFGADGRAALGGYAYRRDLSGMPKDWVETYEEVDAGKRAAIDRYVVAFLDYLKDKKDAVDFSDCSFGNLVFAGIYLKSGNDFNRTAAEMGRLVDSEATLCNVSRGENRTLAALKEDGQILSREAQVVGKQSPVKIAEIFFTDAPIRPEVIASLDGKSIEEKREWIARNALDVQLSDEAERAIRTADIILFGPGTQHSSLFPSYIMAGRAVREAKAPVKAFVTNLHFDHDIQNYTANDLVERALHYLGDPENKGPSITHVLCAEQPEAREDSILLDENRLRPDGTILGATVVRGKFQNPSSPGAHSGNAVVKAVRALSRDAGRATSRPSVDIFVDLYKRSILLEGLLQEFMEIDWHADFDHVTLKLNRVELPTAKIPDFLTLERTSIRRSSLETGALNQWLETSSSEYLVTVTGDGEYRIRDILPAVAILENSSFGVVYGSRAQSRRQLRASLGNAYGDNSLLRGLSLAGTFSVSALFLLRHQMVLSDPMTGLRVYRRSALPSDFRSAVREAKGATATKVTNLLIRHGVEICELPVGYRTFPSFTAVGWRLKRGFRNLAGLFS